MLRVTSPLHPSSDAPTHRLSPPPYLSFYTTGKIFFFLFAHTFWYDDPRYATYLCFNRGVIIGILTASFRFSLAPLEPIILPPYKGSTLRGGFGATFRRIVCIMRDKECRECLLKGRCVYSYVFETPPPSDTKVMRKYEAAPHPFVIEPPSGGINVFKPGEELHFGLTLIGRAVDYLPYFVFTFDELGKTGIGKGRGRYELKTVVSQDIPIYSSETKVLAGFGTRMLDLPEGLFGSMAPDSPERVTLNFLTPTRIAYDGRLGLGLEFHILIRNLVRRLSLLSYFHGSGKTLDLDFKGIIEKAKEVKAVGRHLRWYDWERYSGRQEQRINMGGFVGKITFEGPLGPFMPFVRAGEVVHAGKGTTFGLGRYGVEE